MGAAIGGDIGYAMHVSVATCALIGMAAFLSGTIQAPITSFVIIFEMTGHQHMLLPIMLASMLGFMTARLSGARHLYQALSANYDYLLGDADEYKEKERTRCHPERSEGSPSVQKQEILHSANDAE